MARAKAIPASVVVSGTADHGASLFRDSLFNNNTHWQSLLAAGMLDHLFDCAHQMAPILTMGILRAKTPTVALAAMTELLRVVPQEYKKICFVLPLVADNVPAWLHFAEYCSASISNAERARNNATACWPLLRATMLPEAWDHSFEIKTQAGQRKLVCPLEYAVWNFSSHQTLLLADFLLREGAPFGAREARWLMCAKSEAVLPLVQENNLDLKALRRFLAPAPNRRLETQLAVRALLARATAAAALSKSVPDSLA